MSVSVCCALLRVGGADLGGSSRVPAPRERSVHKRTHAQSALFGCDYPGCGKFPQRLSSGAGEKDLRPLPSPRIISHRCNCSSATSEAARDSLCLDCVTECWNSAPAHKHKTRARCAYHVQRAQLL